MAPSKKLSQLWPGNKWRLTFVCFLFLLCTLLPLRVSQACGPVFLEFSGYSFLHADILDQGVEYLPYFVNFENFYKRFPKLDSVQIKSNLQEWQERFCNAHEIEDLRQVIYDSRVEELKVLRTAVKSEKINVPSRFFSNGFARHLKQFQCAETVDYLIFAKYCEPHVTLGNRWEAPQRNKQAMQDLIEEGLRSFKKTKSDYIKLRYAYQLVRLAHYSGDYVRTLELYDFLLPKIDNNPSILEDWILGHKAGALMAMGKNVEASYLFALIFQRCPSKRESAYRSFKIENDEEWHQCQLLCGDDPERATLFALRAHAEDSKAAEEMAEIYQLDPHNKNLELLLVREIRKLEKDLLGLEFNDEKENNRRYFAFPRKQAQDYLEELQKLVRRCAAEKQVTRPQLWRLADGYLEFLNGKLFAARDTFDQLQLTIAEGPLKEQLKALQLALKINQMDYMSNENEEMLYDLIHDEKGYYRQNKYLPDFINDRMAFLYGRHDHPGMAFRCRYRINDLQPNPQMEILDDLLSVSDSTNANRNRLHESFLIDAEGKSIRSKLLDMKGTLLMSQGKFEAAREVLRLIPRAEWDEHQLNPFTESILDCVECPIRDTVFYNKVELIDELFALEYKAKSDMQMGGEYFYRLGLAHYNMSYFGNSWQAMDYFRSGINWDYDKDDVFSHWAYPYGNRENRDCSLAMEYFERARTLAHSPELSAKAAFMAAKCEQKNYFRSKDCDYRGYTNQMPNPPAKYRYYFNLLKKQYANTSFYQEIIKECKYFETYSNK